jgi:23S rRNA (cytidine1920-2'-O)/16S rRNA (cytidine1409-2'-O)-methyltransferase
MKPGKIRLDRLLVERGLAETREKAQAFILAGQVLVNGQKAEKCGLAVRQEEPVELLGGSPKYVSRAGRKLDGALDHFQIDPRRKICLDVGASTGGFTDCLLQHGAERVIAVDVGTHQLDWKLRCDPRIKLLEQTNARYLSLEQIGIRCDLVTMDVSFISSTLILPVLPPLLELNSQLLVLVKPQFELRRAQVGKGGIVWDERLHQQAVEKVSRKLRELDFTDLAVAESVLPGAEGNREYFVHALWRKSEVS